MAALADLTIDYLKFRCDVDEDTGCWHWRTSSKGCRAMHPQIHVRDLGRPVLVRRALWAAKNGVSVADVPEDRFVILNESKCRDPKCVCPEHAKLVSKKEKIRYSLKKANANKLKRQVANATARRKYAKLDDEIVAHLRMTPMAGPGKKSDAALMRELAERGISVCRKTISQARRGLTWRTYGSVFGGLLPSRGG